MPDGFLGVEALILRRLEERVKPLVRVVLPAADLAGVRESEQITPAVHVVFDGYRPVQERAEGLIQVVEQRWLVIAAVRNVRDPAGAGAREDVGPIVDAVLSALAGWRPGPQWTHLKLAAAPRAGFSAGFLYMPLAFTTRRMVRGEP